MSLIIVLVKVDSCHTFKYQYNLINLMLFKSSLILYLLHEGIQTSSVESNVKWLIEVSKNDLTTSSSGKILTYTDNSKVSLLVGPSVVANVPERVGGGGN